MKKIGCGIAVLGILLVVGSFALFGMSITRAIEANQAASIPITVGEEVTTDVIDVDTSRLCQVTLAVDVRTESVQEKEDDAMREPGDPPEFEARYDFPFRYTVLDADGNTIFSGSDHIAWDRGMRSNSGRNVDATGGTVSVEHMYDKFPVPPPGRIRIRIEVDPDTTYEARAESVTLNVYDNVSKQGASVFGGFASMCAGPILVFIGIVVFVVGLLTGKQGRNTGEPSGLGSST